MDQGSPELAGPTVLVIGAGKAGTSTVHRMLDTLSTVHMSTPKEIEYFSHPEHPDYPLSWYYEYFRAGAGLRHRGESSPTYTMYPLVLGVPERIHRMDPDVRLIYLVREPVSRMVSAYGQACRMGYERRPIDQALTRDLGYFAPSMYWLQLSEYLRFFDRDQIHVEDLDDLRQDPMGVLARMARFLDVSNDGRPVAPANPANRRIVRRGYAPVLDALRRRGLAKRGWQRSIQSSPMGSRRLQPEAFRLSPEVAQEVGRFFTSDIEALEDFFSRSFAHWGTSRRGGSPGSS